MHMRIRQCVVFCLLFVLTATAQQTSVTPSPSQTSIGQPAANSSLAVSPRRAEQKGRSASGLVSSATMDHVVDRIIEREHALMEMLKTCTPLVETYLQDLKSDPRIGPIPVQDHYFLGRLDLGESVDRHDYLSKHGSFQSRLLGGFTTLYKFRYEPLGFSWMIFADRKDFDRKTYNFEYDHSEFLGDVRCLVFAVTPKKGADKGRFRGQIWVEDQAYSIVRLNGIYEPGPRHAYFFHMDSWRLNLVPGYWLPAYVYSEEGDFSYGSKNEIAFKAQTRIWGYNLKKGSKDSELTEVFVDPSVKDESAAAQDASPLQAQRNWLQHAEENVIERVQTAGLLAPKGELDTVLETVVNNLLISNNIELQRPACVRLMLTSPLETFSVGNTIILSRGLVDVLPDESSLAMVLAHELAHIVLGHNLGSKYAFSDRMLFSDESIYSNLGFRHAPEEETAADKKAVDLLKNSPYGQKLGTAGLFLRQVGERGPALSALLTPHLGNGFTGKNGRVTRMVALMNSAPAIDPNKLDQIAALPLGGRVKLNPWDDRVELIKTSPTAILSVRDKMPLEVTPFSPHLTRQGAIADTTASASTATPRN